MRLSSFAVVLSIAASCAAVVHTPAATVAIPVSIEKATVRGLCASATGIWVLLVNGSQSELVEIDRMGNRRAGFVAPARYWKVRCDPADRLAVMERTGTSTWRVRVHGQDGQILSEIPGIEDLHDVLFLNGRLWGQIAQAFYDLNTEDHRGPRRAQQFEILEPYTAVPLQGGVIALATHLSGALTILNPETGRAGMYALQSVELEEVRRKTKGEDEGILGPITGWGDSIFGVLPNWWKQDGMPVQKFDRYGAASSMEWFVLPVVSGEGKFSVGFDVTFNAETGFFLDRGRMEVAIYHL